MRWECVSAATSEVLAYSISISIHRHETIETIETHFQFLSYPVEQSIQKNTRHAREYTYQSNPNNLSCPPVALHFLSAASTRSQSWTASGLNDNRLHANMSRRGRGGRGGAAGMRGPPLPFDISPELEAYANGHGPTEDEFLNSLFPVSHDAVSWKELPRPGSSSDAR